MAQGYVEVMVRRRRSAHTADDSSVRDVEDPAVGAVEDMLESAAARHPAGH